MGVVYRATQIALERIVALKVIAPELLDNDEIRQRFLAEAHAAASFDHPNVIPVYEAGEADGTAYIAMRFVAGSDLHCRVRNGGGLAVAEAASVIGQAGAAIDEIHRAGFVHRDVKPANLLIDATGHVYQSDFGLAKQVLTRSGATRSGQWVGTLDYVAPEQIRGGRIDARADVYALGGVLHFALTGGCRSNERASGEDVGPALAPPPVPSALRPDVPRAFDAVVARAMTKDPERRYPSAGDLGRAARGQPRWARCRQSPSGSSPAAPRPRARPPVSPASWPSAVPEPPPNGLSPPHRRRCIPAARRCLPPRGWSRSQSPRWRWRSSHSRARSR